VLSPLCLDPWTEEQVVTTLEYRHHRKPKLPYQMAVMEMLSYWGFDKWSLPENISGFHIQNDLEGLNNGLTSSLSINFEYKCVNFRRHYHYLHGFYLIDHKKK
jgi:hypothetical protein